MDLFSTLSQEINVSVHQIEAAVELLDQGATVPFIARYRKEKTDGMDDIQLRQLEERLHYLRELEDRRKTILESIRQQQKLTPELEKSIIDAKTKVELEDLYLPYKPKRRTKGQIAKEAGIEPLAWSLLENPMLTPHLEAEKYINAEMQFTNAEEVLDGAKAILVEHFSETAPLLAELRSDIQQHGFLFSKVCSGKEAEGTKFKDYFDFSEKVSDIPSHRLLAILRGRKEGFLQTEVDLALEDKSLAHPYETKIARFFNIDNQRRPGDAYLQEVVVWAWKTKLHPHLETEITTLLREQSEEEAIRVFSRNLKSLLLSPPAGAKVTMGLDPGLRTGVKVAVVDTTGKLLEYITIFPHAPMNKKEQSLATLKHLIEKHHVDLISIGNGTAGRETENLVRELMKAHPEMSFTSLVVNEAGASVYSASELASKELPNLDVTYRGAVSIARRLQDPLAELVKIEPKSIGVGQYQHDVNQAKLARSLNGAVEDCVNAVGVDVNTASAALLTHVAGLNQTIAKNIVEFRDSHGRFVSRDQLKKVPRFGEKTFEQAAGFLKIVDGTHPLDASSVHPESYSIVQRMAEKNQLSIHEMMGNQKLLATVKPEEFVTEQFGLPTLIDILHELEKPGRDPRPEFRAVQYKEGVLSINDLQIGMVMEGIVTNVTNFGAFVDIGVHQDGLVHISVLAERFVKDPHEVIKTGAIVKVKVTEVDTARKRIGLSMRLNDPTEKSAATQTHGNRPRNSEQKARTNTYSQEKRGTAQPTDKNKSTEKGRKETWSGSKGKEANADGKTGTFADLFANAKALKSHKK